MTQHKFQTCNLVVGSKSKSIVNNFTAHGPINKHFKKIYHNLAAETSCHNSLQLKTMFFKTD